MSRSPHRPKPDPFDGIELKVPKTPEEMCEYLDAIKRRGDEEKAVAAFGAGLAELGRGIALRVKIHDKPEEMIAKLWRRVLVLERDSHDHPVYR